MPENVQEASETADGSTPPRGSASDQAREANRRYMRQYYREKIVDRGDLPPHPYKAQWHCRACWRAYERAHRLAKKMAAAKKEAVA